MAARCCWCQAAFVRSGAWWLCPTPTCAREQWRWAVQANGTWRYVPLPKQIEAHRHPAINLLFGGAAGGTKSHWLRWDAYLRCVKQPRYRALLLRRTYKELEDTHIERALVEVPQLGGLYAKSEYRASWPNGSQLRFGHLSEETLVSQYLSTEYDWIGPDELVTFPERPMLLIFSRARSATPGVVPVIRAATNPGGLGAQWIKRRWLDQDVTPEEDPAYDRAHYAYVPATLDDNPYLDAHYERRLLTLPADLRRAYRYGDWNIFPGQYFTSWRADRHVVARTIGLEVDRVCAIDWGYVKPGVVLWIALLPDGHAHVEEEYVFQRTVARDVAQEIRRRSQMPPRRIRYRVADTQMWSHDSGESIAETFARAQVGLIPATKDRLVGWQRLQHWLADAPDGQPWLTVAPSCRYLIRTLPAQEMDPQQPEDLNTTGDDHACDALRYFVMSRPTPTRAARLAPEGPNTVGALLRALLPGAPRPLGTEQVRGRDR